MNESFTATPQEEAANTASTASGTTANTGSRTYSVTVPSDVTDVNIALFDADNVTTTGENTTFKSASPINTGNVAIETVNGAAVGSAGTTNTYQVNDVKPVNGLVTFTIDSTTAGVDAVPVVYSDTVNDDSNALEFTTTPTATATQEPREDFGVGGRKNWVAQEAALGTVAGDIRELNTRIDYYTVDTTGNDNVADVTVYYDSNDVFQYQGVGISMADFERIAGTDAIVSTSYNPSPEGVSTHNVTTAAVTAPTNAKATVSDLDADGTRDDATITWTASTSEGVVYDVRRSTVDTTCDNADTLVADNVSGTSTTVLNNPNDADTVFCVYAQDPNTGASSAAAPTAQTTLPGSADTAGPQSDEYTAVTTDSGFDNEGDTGDVWRIVFNEAVQVEAGDAIRVLDGTDATQAGTEEQYQIVCGTNATCATNASASTIGGTSYEAGRILTVTLTTVLAPVATVTGGNNRLDYPAFIINSAGITDSNGNSWDLAGSADRTLEVDEAAPVITAAAGDESANTLTVTYSEAVRCLDNADSRSQFVWDDATANVSPTAVTCNGTTTVVLTFAAGELLDADDTGALTYTQSAIATNRVQGLDGRDATSPDTEAATVAA